MAASSEECAESEEDGGAAQAGAAMRWARSVAVMSLASELWRASRRAGG